MTSLFSQRFGIVSRSILSLTLLFLPSSIWGQRTLAPVFQFASDPNLRDTPTGITFDGTYYWAVRGGSTQRFREAQYFSDGSLVADFKPGIDFRSIFFHAQTGSVLARKYNNNYLYKQVSPGVFTPLLLLLGGNLDSQASVVFNGDCTEFIAQDLGVVTRWDLEGNAIGTVVLQGYGAVPGEDDYPANRGIAALGDLYLTYSNGVVSAWNSSGSRVFYANLAGAGSSEDANFSFSAANGLVFTDDDGVWRGYDLRFANTR